MNRQQVVTTVQMDNLSDSVADASKKLDNHIKHVDLSNIEYGVVRIGDKMETFLSDVEESRERMDMELTNMNKSVDSLSNQQETIDNLNELFHNTVKTLRETLKSIDDKVCQISPLYTGPSAKDIEESFNQMASTDITHLMDELHDKYQQTTKEITNTEQSDDEVIVVANDSEEVMGTVGDDASTQNDNVVEPVQIVVTLPDEAPKEELIKEHDSNDSNESHTKGFLSRLFGGDN